jgi:Icc protein
MDVTTVAEDEAVLHDGVRVERHEGLNPDTEYTFGGETVRTLPRPPGERLATLATVNDVHFGETECGVIDGTELGPVLHSEPGEPPYPETMNRAATREIAAIHPDVVVVKGDLTNGGTRAEYQAFLDCYGPVFGTRLIHVQGNHESYHGQTFGDRAPVERQLPGVTVAVLDTTLPHKESGGVSADQLDWLDELGGRADRPVLVFGHHHPWNPDSASREETYFGINPTDAERLIAVFARRPALVGYFAGHTHRNRVRRFRTTGDVPFVEVACVKDFPGAWAEYRVYEGGILQVFRRISSPEALAWSERTRVMYAGLYAGYAFGSLDERCFPIWPRVPEPGRHATSRPRSAE